MLTLSDIYHIIDQQLFDNGKKESFLYFFQRGVCFVVSEKDRPIMAKQHVCSRGI
jgi:hypothetical protein